MTLTPYTPVFKAATSDFNHKAARAAYDLVMKLDYDSAQVLTSMIVTDVLEETIEKNLVTIQRQLNKVIAKRIKDVQRATLRSVSKAQSDEALAFAEALGEISKVGAAQRYGYVFNERDFNRDPSSGRFRTKISHTQTKPINPRQAKAMSLPADTKGLHGRELAHYQDEYRQLASFLQVVNASGEGGTHDVMLHLQDKKTGERYSTTITASSSPKKAGKEYDPTTERLIGVEARPSGLNFGGAAFGLTTALGASPQTGASVRRTAGAVDSGMSEFADTWTGSYDAKNSNARLYGRLEGGSQFLGNVAVPGSKLQMAAAFGEFVGSHGAEAEKVFGPATRKAAYRYRGTEKTPDQHIVSLYGRAISQAKAQNYSPGEEALPGVKEPRRVGKPDEVPPVTAMANLRALSEGRAPTWEERELGRQVVVDQLRFKLPNKHLYGLQLASGKTPPSEGILINREGQIVTQAVGYGDDHYLPFNLRNLKALKGGEYIRTRSVGGPTSEDIYTGLLTGARRLTVVSRSGTFTVEFDSELRGGRRYNDKARQMTGRYEHILDAVQSEMVDAKPVPPHIQDKIRAEVESQYGSWPQKDKVKVFKEKLEEYKTFEGLTPDDKAYIEQRVALEVSRDHSVNEKSLRSDLTAQALAEKQFKYRLDGPGYESALQALEEQFPYYIKVRSKPIRDSHIAELESDKGYVRPRHNRPTAALEGYFDARVAGEADTIRGKKTGKFSASEANYQNARNTNGRTEEPRALSASSDGGEESGGGVSSAPSPQAQVVENITERKDEADYASKAWDLIAGTARTPDYDRQNPIAAMVTGGDRSGFEARLKTPEGRHQTEAMIRAGAGSYAANQEAHTAFWNTATKVDRQNYTPQASGRWPDKPFKFAGDEFRKTADPIKVQEKMNALDRESFAVSDTRNYSELSDAQKKTELDQLLLLKANASALASAEPSAMEELLRPIGVNNTGNAMRLVRGGDAAIQKQIDNLHMMRTLQANMDGRVAAVDPRAVAGAVRTVPSGGPSLPAELATLSDDEAADKAASISEKSTQAAELASAHGSMGNIGQSDNLHQIANEGKALLDRLMDASQPNPTPQEIKAWEEKYTQAGGS